MKLHYFHQVIADSDDFLLDQAKRDGKVPTNCLLGGRLLRPHLDLGRDPCQTCNGPRPVCGGSPQVSESELLSHQEIERIEAQLGESQADLSQTIHLFKRR